MASNNTFQLSLSFSLTLLSFLGSGQMTSNRLMVETRRRDAEARPMMQVGGTTCCCLEEEEEEKRILGFGLWIQLKPNPLWNLT